MSRANIGKLCSKKRSRGQAIYLALAAIIFLSLMTFAAFNISQMTHAKSQTMNAADAGAYTLAVTVARDLNFMAYTNRAMVANHAVVGQLTSLASLSNMIYLASRDLQMLQYLRWIPYVGWILGEIGDAFEALADAIEDVVWPGLEYITQFQDMLIQGISLMQIAAHGFTVIDMQKTEDVIKANDPELKWATTDGGGKFSTVNNVTSLMSLFAGGFISRQGDSAGGFGFGGVGGGSGGCDAINDDSGNPYYDWYFNNPNGPGYTPPDGNWGFPASPGLSIGPGNPGAAGGNSAQDRMREVVNDSRDGFTVRREWVEPPASFVPSIESSYLFHGGTKLSCDNKTWVGVDGFEMEICWDPFNFWDEDCETIRLWMTGETAGSEEADDWRKLSHGGLTNRGHRRAYQGRSSQNPRLDWDGLADEYSGLQPYYELSADPKPGESPSPTFVVVVYKPVESSDASNITRTPNATQTFQTDSGNPLHLAEGRAKIYGVAAAHAFFRRPAKSDNDPSAGRLPNELYKDGTYATLFAPYWQARLTNLPSGITAALAAFGD